MMFSCTIILFLVSRKLYMPLEGQGYSLYCRIEKKEVDGLEIKIL